MKKPYLTQEERQHFNGDSFRSAAIRLHHEFKILERDCYRRYWIFGYFVIRLIMRGVLKPINKQIKENWYKSNGRRCI